MPKRKLYGEVKPQLSRRRRNPTKELLTNHESFVRNGVVLALKKVTQKKQHANDNTERDNVILSSWTFGGPKE